MNRPVIFQTDAFEEIFQTIGRNKLRTLLTMLGVFWGIFMFVLLMGSGNGLENGTEANFGGFNVQSAFVWPSFTTGSRMRKLQERRKALRVTQITKCASF
jgi:putative ABC transport system permease protein